MTLRRGKLALLLGLALGAPACDDGGGAGQPGDPGGDARLLESDLPRELSPAVPAADLEALVEGNTAFAIDLYHALRQETDGNLFYSPFSISQALAMTWAGARGQTEADMAATLHFDGLGQDRLHPAQNALDLALASRGDVEVGPDDGEPPVLEVANSVWGREGESFLPDFLDTLARHYGAGLRELDFAGDPAGARETINTWVEEKTRDRIQYLLPEGLLGADTVMVLVNAIYLKASWATPFVEHATADADFHLLPSDETVRVPTMQVDGHFAHTLTREYEAIALPYAGGQLSMLVVEPADLARFEADLDAARLEAIVGDLRPGSVDVRLPKFRVEAAFGLNDVLADLGMAVAFGGDADFSGMVGRLGLYISAVVHKAFIAVDEAGTEAAAATAVVVGETAAPLPGTTIAIDRPFLVLIRDEPTGSVLFMGRVVDPR